MGIPLVTVSASFVLANARREHSYGGILRLSKWSFRVQGQLVYSFKQDHIFNLESIWKS